MIVVFTHNKYDLITLFEKCEIKKSVINEYTMRLNQLDIYVCRKPFLPPEQFWPQFQAYR
jgi:hypothetical protein